MSDERSVRIEKLSQFRASGFDPYPSAAHRTHSVADALAAKEGSAASIAGRIYGKRDMGKIMFCHIGDESGRMQAVLKQDETGPDAYDRFVRFADSGDIISISGSRFVTQKGEQSVLVHDWAMLAKSLRPLPDKFHGLHDEETRLRKRYLHFLTDPESRELFRKKSIFWNAIRSFLVAEGFLEVETPALETTAGGADARPFVTHHNALDIDVYLRISCGELWQKRLMVGGFEKTFEIGRIFRNEGMSPEHAQDYTQMELYWAYANYRDGMKLVERLYKQAALAAFGTLSFTSRSHDVDLGKPWETYDFTSVVKEKTGIDVLDTTAPEVEKTLKKLGVAYDPKGFNFTRAVDTLWKYCRKDISGPGFLVNVPVELEPLAKRNPKNPRLVERYQVMIAGSEVGKGYSELNDPIDQAERFAAQEALRAGGDEEAQMFDRDFVEALEHGMPPTTGFGVSERLFSFLAGLPIRECQLFPLLRPVQDDTASHS